MRWKQTLASVFGSGFLPIAPGTWGAAVGALCLLPFYETQHKIVLAIGLILVCTIGTWLGAKIAHELEPEWGEDPKQFVWDETIGMWITMIGHLINWKTLLAGFLLFRLFDIVKPFGIRQLENVPKGYGVMLDDVAAGIAANIVLVLLIYFGL
jgi:phosphatidylglycerophosphatase A